VDKKGNHSHILVIRLSAMGDVAMLAPIFSALQSDFPNVRITLLTKAQFAPIFSELSNVAVFPVMVKGEHKGFLGLFRLFRSLKRKRIDAVADTHNVLRSNVLKFLFQLSGVPVVQLNKGRAQKKALTRSKNKVFKPLKTTHERYADVFRKLGYAIALKEDGVLAKLPLPQKAVALLENKPKKIIGVAPFAAHQGKMYPIVQMEKVIGLLEGEDCTVLLFGGGKQEEEILKGISEKLGPNVLSVAGNMGLGEELALLSNIDAMVSMDSGNGHLAANYSVPVITIWGVTHPYAGFAPFAQGPSRSLMANREEYPLIPTSIYGNTFPKGYEHAIETITPQQVFEKIKQVW